MLRQELTYEDARKLDKAHRCINATIENIEKYNRELDLPGKPSAMLIEARRLLSEVLYGK